MLKQVSLNKIKRVSEMVGAEYIVSTNNTITINPSGSEIIAEGKTSVVLHFNKFEYFVKVHDHKCIGYRKDIIPEKVYSFTVQDLLLCPVLGESTSIHDYNLTINPFPKKETFYGV